MNLSGVNEGVPTHCLISIRREGVGGKLVGEGKTQIIDLRIGLVFCRQIKTISSCSGRSWLKK